MISKLNNRCKAALIALLTTLAITLGIAAEVTKPIQLLPAKDLSSFYVWTRRYGLDDPNKVFTLTNGVLRISGGEQGFLATQAGYSNYQLVAEYKWGKAPGAHDSAIFVHAADSSKGGFMLSLKCELASGLDRVSGQTFLIGTNLLTVGGQIRKGYARLPILESANPELPPGEWNTAEILCDRGRIEVKINGHLMTQGAEGTAQQGKILLQSMTNEIFFRRLELKPLK